MIDFSLSAQTEANSSQQRKFISTTNHAPATSQYACHNCRRQRLKCDRSIPHCAKCTKRAQECLGYGQLFRWQSGVAARGRLTGVTFGKEVVGGDACSTSPLLITRPSPQNRHFVLPGAISLVSLTDPLVQDLNHASRFYLSYFASDVCKDLVLYDSTQQNPFCDLVPLTQQHPLLLQIIIANSALHVFNSARKHMKSNDRGSEKSLQCRNLLISRPYFDHLTAKHRALNMLRNALIDLDITDSDVILAVMILFVELELLDSGRNNWKHHIEGARTIIAILCKPHLPEDLPISRLRSCLISNWMVFDTLGSMLASPKTSNKSDGVSPHLESLFRDAEGTHCSSFPSILLRLIHTGTRLSQQDEMTPIEARQNKLFVLICAAKSFDASAWAREIQLLSPIADVEQRTMVARAHTAAVIIYLSRLLVSLYTTTKPSCNFEALVTEALDNISGIDTSSPLFTATTWPTFIAGAETNLAEKQQWIATRFRERWAAEPWGLLEGALETLTTIWALKRGRAEDKGTMLSSGHDIGTDGDWVQYLRNTGVDWLIL
ncbi:hypothetical protein E4T44_00009 [Aureobasidium sp. EXF-8845]|nr:hypothetical protein E4T44_00009 [Aureobasidium sp. EXF-8845]KAI4858455.1 hypothetical protein E4T45_00026 [Aureobasidium sp. EXF-8846]